MRKILSLFMSLMLTTAMFAAEFTYVFADQGYANAEDAFSGVIDETTNTIWEATPGTNPPKYYNSGTGLRIYNGGTFTISSDKTITSITLTFSGTGYTFSSDNTNAEQTEEPNDFSYTWNVTRTCRLQKIVVVVADGEVQTLATPRLSQNSQNFTDDIVVTVENAYDDDVVVRYTVDGSDVTESSEVFPAEGLTISGVTTTIKVVAYQGTLVSAQTTATFTYVEPAPAVTRLADLTEVETTYNYTGRAVVVRHPTGDNRYLYIQDESGSALIYKTGLTQFEEGDVLAPFEVKCIEFQGLLELQPANAANITKVESGAEVTIPTLVNEAPTLADMNKIVVLQGVKPTENVTLESSDAKKTFNVEIAGTTLVFRNTFKIDATMEAASEFGYDIEAAVSVFNTLQLVPTAITARSESATALQMIENNGIRYFNNVLYNHNQVRMQIFNVNGAKVADTTADFDMNGLANGVYMVHANNAVLKIVK